MAHTPAGSCFFLFYNEYMRLFIAVIPDECTKDRLCEVQDEMHDAGFTGHFTERDNLHLTLAFIGEYSDPLYVEEVLEAVRFEPVRLCVDHIGCIRDLWWAGVAENAELEKNVRRIRHALSGAGIPFDRRRFLPHITLLRNGHNTRQVSVEVSAFETDELHAALMRSDRGRHGMVYTELMRPGVCYDDESEDEEYD